MPTIDQLAPATAAADTDEHIVSQAGTALKMTRAQILAGVQPQLALQSGTLLGRSSAGTGAPESLAVGANLTLSTGTLSASAMPYVIGALPAGTVPAPGDLIPLSQGGTNSAVPYSQFLSGLPEIANVDASQMLLTATGSTTSVKLADFAAGVLPIAGGSMTGPLTLPAIPTAPLQAAAKTYVDSQLATALPRAGGTLSGPLTLAADPAAALQAATKEYVDTRIFRSGDTLTGGLILASDPVSALQAATKHYVDNQTATNLPISGGTLTGPVTLAANPTAALQAAPKQYVDAQVATSLPLSGGTVSGPIVLSANPTTALQAAPKQYVDGQIATALPISGGTLTGPLTLANAPTTPFNAATKQYVDSASGGMTGVINVKSAPYNANLMALQTTRQLSSQPTRPPRPVQ